VTKSGDSPTGPDGRVECSSEAEIFKVLGLAYVPPHLRTWY
jgi:DNA polymerase/3'-5' exonuclease PolX